VWLRIIAEAWDWKQVFLSSRGGSPLDAGSSGHICLDVNK
jgi:hypothetical protein